jgi:hypothetical protein
MSILNRKGARESLSEPAAQSKGEREPRINSEANRKCSARNISPYLTSPTRPSHVPRGTLKLIETCSITEPGYDRTDIYDGTAITG